MEPFNTDSHVQSIIDDGLYNDRSRTPPFGLSSSPDHDDMFCISDVYQQWQSDDVMEPIPGHDPPLHMGHHVSISSAQHCRGTEAHIVHHCSHHQQPQQQEQQEQLLLPGGGATGLSRVSSNTSGSSCSAGGVQAPQAHPAEHSAGLLTSWPSVVPATLAGGGGALNLPAVNWPAWDVAAAGHATAGASNLGPTHHDQFLLQQMLQQMLPPLVQAETAQSAAAVTPVAACIMMPQHLVGVEHMASQADILSANLALGPGASVAWGGSAWSSHTGMLQGGDLCEQCHRLQNVGAALHQQLRTDPAAATGRKEVEKGIAALLVGIATGCSGLKHGSSKPCLALLQLPEDAVDCWYVTLPKARAAVKGHQRAPAGTSIARQFNFHVNSPNVLSNSNELLQMLQPNSDNDVPAGQQGSIDLYSIRSRDRHAVAYALARRTDAAAAAVPPRMSQAGDALWLHGSIKCSKKAHKLQGQLFDAFKWAYVSVGNASGLSSRCSKSKRADDCQLD